MTLIGSFVLIGFGAIIHRTAGLGERGDEELAWLGADEPLEPLPTAGPKVSTPRPATTPPRTERPYVTRASAARPPAGFERRSPGKNRRRDRTGGARVGRSFVGRLRSRSGADDPAARSARPD